MDIALYPVLQLGVIQALPPAPIEFPQEPPSKRPSQESSGVQLDFEERDLSDSEKTLASLKARVVRIGMTSGRVGFKFAEAMFDAFTELKDA